MKMVALAMTAILLAGCAKAISGNTNGIRIAKADEVKQCEFLSDVHGMSSFYGVFGAPALQSSRNAAMAEAAKLGATHVVWGAANTGYGSTSISADAYRCK